MLLNIDFVEHHIFLFGIYVGFHLHGDMPRKHREEEAFLQMMTVIVRKRQVETKRRASCVERCYLLSGIEKTEGNYIHSKRLFYILQILHWLWQDNNYFNYWGHTVIFKTLDMKNIYISAEKKKWWMASVGFCVCRNWHYFFLWCHYEFQYCSRMWF